MKHGMLASLLIATGLLPGIAAAQAVDLNIANNTKFVYSLEGDSGECLLNLAPFSIKTLPWKDASRLCRSDNCTVKIYASWGCKVLTSEGSFTWVTSYGAANPWSQYSSSIKIQTSSNNVFITGMGTLPVLKAGGIDA